MEEEEARKKLGVTWRSEIPWVLWQQWWKILWKVRPDCRPMTIWYVKYKNSIQEGTFMVWWQPFEFRGRWMVEEKGKCHGGYWTSRMSWRNSIGVNSNLEEISKVIKIFHEEWEWILIIWEFSFSILDTTSLSIARWVLTYPASEPISREWYSHRNWLWERPP